MRENKHKPVVMNERIAKAAEVMNVPLGVAAGVVTDLKGLQDGAAFRKLSENQIMEKWDIGVQKLRRLKAEPGLMEGISAVMAEKACVLAAFLMDGIMDDMTSDDGARLKELCPEKKSRMLRAVTDAAMTFKDGHKAPVTFNMGDMMDRFAQLERAKDGLKVVKTT